MTKNTFAKKFFSAIGRLLFLVVMGALVFRKIDSLLPGIRPAGWAILVIFFILIVTISVIGSTLIIKRWRIPEERAEWLAVALSLGISLLLLYFAWLVAAPYIQGTVPKIF